MNIDEIDQLVTTPELDVVRIVSVQDREVLLVKESDDPNWKLPGGKIHAGETIFEALVREIEEELGITVAREDILNYQSAKIPHSENIRHLFLLKTIQEDQVLATEEVEECGYFSVEDLPETKFKEHIASAFEIISS